MSSCNNQECNWFLAKEIPDVYVPNVHVDISLWVCRSCGDVKAVAH